MSNSNFNQINRTNEHTNDNIYHTPTNICYSPTINEATDINAIKTNLKAYSHIPKTSLYYLTLIEQNLLETLTNKFLNSYSTIYLSEGSFQNLTKVNYVLDFLELRIKSKKLSEVFIHNYPLFLKVSKQVIIKTVSLLLDEINNSNSDDNNIDDKKMNVSNIIKMYKKSTMCLKTKSKLNIKQHILINFYCVNFTYMINTLTNSKLEALLNSQHSSVFSINNCLVKSTSSIKQYLTYRKYFRQCSCEIKLNFKQDEEKSNINVINNNEGNIATISNGSSKYFDSYFSPYQSNSNPLKYCYSCKTPFLYDKYSDVYIDCQEIQLLHIRNIIEFQKYMFCENPENNLNSIISDLNIESKTRLLRFLSKDCQNKEYNLSSLKIKLIVFDELINKTKQGDLISFVGFFDNNNSNCCFNNKEFLLSDVIAMNINITNNYGLIKYNISSLSNSLNINEEQLLKDSLDIKTISNDNEKKIANIQEKIYSQINILHKNNTVNNNKEDQLTDNPLTKDKFFSKDFHFNEDFYIKDKLQDLYGQSYLNIMSQKLYCFFSAFSNKLLSEWFSNDYSLVDKIVHSDLNINNLNGNSFFGIGDIIGEKLFLFLALESSIVFFDYNEFNYLKTLNNQKIQYENKYSINLIKNIIKNIDKNNDENKTQINNSNIENKEDVMLKSLLRSNCLLFKSKLINNNNSGNNKNNPISNIRSDLDYMRIKESTYNELLLSNNNINKVKGPNILIQNINNNNDHQNNISNTIYSTDSQISYIYKENIKNTNNKRSKSLSLLNENKKSTSQLLNNSIYPYDENNNDIDLDYSLLLDSLDIPLTKTKQNNSKYDQETNSNEFQLKTPYNILVLLDKKDYQSLLISSIIKHYTVNTNNIILYPCFKLINKKQKIKELVIEFLLYNKNKIIIIQNIEELSKLEQEIITEYLELYLYFDDSNRMKTSTNRLNMQEFKHINEIYCLRNVFLQFWIFSNYSCFIEDKGFDCSSNNNKKSFSIEEGIHSSFPYNKLVVLCDVVLNFCKEVNSIRGISENNINMLFSLLGIDDSTTNNQNTNNCKNFKNKKKRTKKSRSISKDGFQTEEEGTLNPNKKVNTINEDIELRYLEMTLPKIVNKLNNTSNSIKLKGMQNNKNKVSPIITIQDTKKIKKIITDKLNNNEFNRINKHSESLSSYNSIINNLRSKNNNDYLMQLEEAIQANTKLNKNEANMLSNFLIEKYIIRKLELNKLQEEEVFSIWKIIKAISFLRQSINSLSNNKEIIIQISMEDVLLGMIFIEESAYFKNKNKNLFGNISSKLIYKDDLKKDLQQSCVESINEIANKEKNRINGSDANDKYYDRKLMNIHKDITDIVISEYVNKEMSLNEVLNNSIIGHSKIKLKGVYNNDNSNNNIDNHNKRIFELNKLIQSGCGFASCLEEFKIITKEDKIREEHISQDFDNSGRLFFKAMNSYIKEYLEIID